MLLWVLNGSGENMLLWGLTGRAGSSMSTHSICLRGEIRKNILFSIVKNGPYPGVERVLFRPISANKKSQR